MAGYVDPFAHRLRPDAQRSPGDDGPPDDLETIIDISDQPGRDERVGDRTDHRDPADV